MLQCDEPYRPGHMCKKGQLYIMEIEDDLTSVESEQEMEVNGENELEGDNDTPSI